MQMKMDKSVLENAVQVWMNSTVFKQPVKVSNVSIAGYGADAVFTFDYEFIGETKPKDIIDSSVQP